MGGSNYPTPPSGGLPAIFAGLEANVAQLHGSPGTSYSKIQGGALEVTDKNGQPKISAGEYIFASGPWSGKTINSIIEFDGLGNPQIILGPQPDGTDGLGIYNQLGVKLSFFLAAGITQYDANGNKLIALTTSGLALLNAAGTLIANLTTSGLENFDTAGQPRSIAGLLPSGDYGLGVYSRDNSGTVQEVLPISTAEVDATLTTSVSSYTPGSGGPFLTVTIGASGKAAVTMGAFIGTGANNEGGFMGLYVDNVPAPSASGDFIGCSFNNTTSSAVAASCSNTRTVTGLTPGSHYFEAWYRTVVPSGSAGVNFSGRTLTIQPL